MSQDQVQASQQFIEEVWGLQGTAYAVVALRYYSRISTLGWRRLAWDDAIMFLAVITYTAESVMGYLVVSYSKGLANNAMTDEQRMALDPQSEEWTLRVNGSKIHVVGLLLYTTLLWLLKGCWLIYYARLTAGVNNMRRIIKWGIVIIAGSYISCLLVALLKCLPFDHQWQINPAPGNNCMPAISFIQTIYVMVMNTITDFYLMAIPIPIVWSSHLPPRKKVVLLIMFSGGLLEMAFGILRCVSILTIGESDSAQAGYWSVRESFVSFVLTNLPMIYPLFKQLLDHGRNMNRRKNTGKEDSRGYRLGSLPDSSKVRAKKQDSMPNDTTWGSKENIILERDVGVISGSGAESLDLPKQQPGLGSEVHATSYGPDIIGGSPERPRRAPSANQILVTTEYGVTEAGPDGPKKYRNPDF